MELPVRDLTGKEVRKVELSDRVYAVPPNPDLLHQAMVYYQANQRQGTHATKTRAMVSGGGRKPFSQKHTGRARMGSIRSPIARHGGVVFGPHPRDYRQRLPKKMRRMATRCVLSGKAQGERLLLVESLELERSKAKPMAMALKAIGVTSSALVVVLEPSAGVSRSVRNLPRIKALTADLLNALDLLRYDAVVMTVETAQRVAELFDDARTENMTGAA